MTPERLREIARQGGLARGGRQWNGLASRMARQANGSSITPLVATQNNALSQPPAPPSPMPSAPSTGAHT